VSRRLLTVPGNRQMNRPVGQHFVQRAYLENFCDPPGKLNSCLLLSSDGISIQPKWIVGSPKFLGKENNLYTLQSGAPFAIEHHLCNIEHAGMQVIARVLEHRPETVSSDDAADLAAYIAYAATRVPAALKLKKIMEPEMEAGRIYGEPINPGPQGIPKDAEAIAKRLGDFKLYTKCFDGRPGTVLVTSDRPVGLFAMAAWDHGHWLQPSPVDSSLPDCWATDVICVFPISTQCVILGCRGSKRTLNEFFKQMNLTSHNEVAAWINAMTAFLANHVYSSSRDVKLLLPGTTVKIVGIEEFVAASEALTASMTEEWPRNESSA
jgi:hypothetical protein